MDHAAHVCQAQTNVCVGYISGSPSTPIKGHQGGRGAKIAPCRSPPEAANPMVKQNIWGAGNRAPLGAEMSSSSHAPSWAADVLEGTETACSTGAY
jgi:hypothetical protein